MKDKLKIMIFDSSDVLLNKIEDSNSARTITRIKDFLRNKVD
jgi:hypothetical protein